MPSRGVERRGQGRLTPQTICSSVKSEVSTSALSCFEGLNRIDPEKLSRIKTRFSSQTGRTDWSLNNSAEIDCRCDVQAGQAVSSLRPLEHQGQAERAGWPVPSRNTRKENWQISYQLFQISQIAHISLLAF